MTRTDGNPEYDRKGIADIFADFYEALYTRRDSAHNNTPPATTTDNATNIPQFTTTELDYALKQLKNNKAKDTAGIIAEMLKKGGNKLKLVLLDLYNEIIKPNATTPQQWKHTRITVIYKSGDKQQPHNYRPISTIPLLYKLFSRLLYNRMEPTLDSQQSHDQAGFRRKFCTEDHLFTNTMIQEIAQEWQIPIWIATLDFKKAFDTVSHDSLWSALAEQGVAPGYITLLAQLYTNQTATVKTDLLSRGFKIQRGTKQGDPLSSLLFNCLSESIFRKVKTIWKKRRAGIRLATNDDTSLTNLRFADDVLLFATSLPALTKMLGDVQQAALETGLELHPDKTKILHNIHNRRPRQQPECIKVHDMSIEVLPHTATQKYLGRKITFHQSAQTEVENRIASGWRKFFLLKRELTTRSYSLKDRLRLFQGTVTPTVLYGSAAWTLTTELENRLKRTQRQMLRMILNSPRRRTLTTPPPAETPVTNNSTTTLLTTTTTTTRPTTIHDDNNNNDDNDDNIDDDISNASDVDSDAPEPQIPSTQEDDTTEPWQDWLRRCTHEAEDHLKKLGAEDWVSMQRRRKWRWAQRVATDNDKWTWKALLWEPVLDRRFQARRQQGRPRKRWTDDITDYLTSLAPNTQQSQQHDTQHDDDTHNPHQNTDARSTNDICNNNGDDTEDRPTTTNLDDDDMQADEEDAPVNGNSAAEGLHHTVASTSWLSLAQDWHKWRALEEEFVKRSLSTTSE